MFSPTEKRSRLVGRIYGDWYAYDKNGKRCFHFKDSQTLNFKVWIQHKFYNFWGFVSRIFPWIYKSDANIIRFGSYKQCLTFEEFMHIAGNAEKLEMFNQSVKYANGEIVLLEDIIKNLPKLKFLDFTCTSDERNVTERTANKLMEIQHFKQMSHIILNNIPETLDIGTMFDFIMENKHIKIELCYLYEISNACRELVQEYNNRLQNENDCDSIISYIKRDKAGYNSTSESNISYSSTAVTNASYISFGSFVDKNDEELMFPWNEKNEEWELPWDKE